METKEKYITQAKLKLDKLDAQIDSLEAEAKKKKIDASASYYSHLADLKSKRSEVAKKFDALKESSGDAMDNLRDGFENVMDDIQTTYHNTKEAVTN